MSNSVESQKSTDIKSTMSDTISGTRDQLTRLGSMVQDFLSSFNATVESSKFVVEKVDGGTRIDFEFKAIIATDKTKTTNSEMTQATGSHAQ